MLHADNPEIRRLLLKGNFGLEKESLRVDGTGHFSHTPHPFPGCKNIVRDFGENQVEINTGTQPTPAAVIAELDRYNAEVQRTLRDLPEREYLWPSSNPPVIINENDIPIAQFEGELAYKTAYREHLSHRYGRYKMTFSGIHFNYSFADELLEADFKLSEYDNFRTYKDQLYIALTERAVAYGWIMTALTAASPVMDMSYVEKGADNKDLFMGFATVRCSELGYWNVFAPVFDYTDVASYADSIEKYVAQGLIKYPSELYYPVRLKPPGENTPEGLRERGVSHIELRMFDLNPLRRTGIEVKDVFFAQLLLAWLASTPRRPLALKDQVQAIQNFKNAARYDLQTVKIVVPDGRSMTVVDAALDVIELMEEFYGDFNPEVTECLRFQKEKFIHPETRYAWQIRQQAEAGFAQRALKLAKDYQARY